MRHAGPCTQECWLARAKRRLMTACILFIKSFAPVFLGVLGSELRPDTVMCEGSALAARYPLRPVIVGVAGAFVAKMLALAFVGNLLLERLPPSLSAAPAIIAAATCVVIALRLVWPAKPIIADKADTSAATGLVMGSGAATVGRSSRVGWMNGPQSTSFWKVAAIAFIVLFWNEWFDRSSQLVMEQAVGPVWIGLGAAIGGATALLCREMLLILLGARLQRFMVRRGVRYALALFCIIGAFMTLTERMERREQRDLSRVAMQIGPHTTARQLRRER